LYNTFLPDLQRLKAVMEQRAKAFVNYRHFIAIRAKFFFQMMLSQRGYNGKMSFDHGNEILGLQVRLFLSLGCFSKGVLKWLYPFLINNLSTSSLVLSLQKLAQFSSDRLSKESLFVMISVR